MGLFRRMRDDEGFIDLGDQIAGSDERADELADFAMQRIVESYDEPVAEEAHQAMLGAITERKPDLSGKAGSILLTTARMGYAAREYEESFDSIQSEVPMLTNELRVLLDAGALVSDAMGGVAGSLCEYSRDDPNAPRSIDAIDGLDSLRDKITRRIAITSVKVAQETGEFPNGVEAMDIIVAFRIGFLVRSCEASLPDDVELTTDTRRRSVMVNVTAATDAVEEWWLANPDASEEEAEAMYHEILKSPRFHADLSSEEDPRFADSEYAIVEVDQGGHVVPQRPDQHRQEDRALFEASDPLLQLLDATVQVAQLAARLSGAYLAAFDQALSWAAMGPGEKAEQGGIGPERLPQPQPAQAAGVAESAP